MPETDIITGEITQEDYNIARERIIKGYKTGNNRHYSCNCLVAVAVGRILNKTVGIGVYVTVKDAKYLPTNEAYNYAPYGLIKELIEFFDAQRDYSYEDKAILDRLPQQIFLKRI